MVKDFPHNDLKELVKTRASFAYVRFSPSDCRLFLSEKGEEGVDRIDIYTFGREDKRKVTLYDAPVASTDRRPAKIEATRSVQSREDYLKSVGKIVDLLKEIGGKTVYSRRKLVVSTANPVDVAEEYFSRHADDFCFLYFTPSTGLWLGATPELIVEVNDKKQTIRSMSVAGTAPVDSPAEWDAKNVEEHQFVLDYILILFEGLGLKVESVKQNDVTSGAVRHLRHDILAKGTADLTDLTLRLSPTPAISGLPVCEALRQIAEFEPLPRYCYGGEIIVTSKDRNASYLNLRSALASYDASTGEWIYNIFCGGGITDKSVPENEWEETELKAESLADSIKKVELKQNL